MMPDTINLRCQTVVDGSLLYITISVSPESWDSMDGALREDLRTQVRSELWQAVVERTGQDLSRNSLKDLPVWDEWPGRCEVELINGPFDGKRITLSTPEPPPMIKLPCPKDVQSLLDTDHLPEETPYMSYWPQPDDHGFFTRTHDGAWRFGHR